MRTEDLSPSAFADLYTGRSPLVERAHGTDSTQLTRPATTPTPRSRFFGEIGLRLDRPLSYGWCVGGWAFASVLFIALVALLGGPSLVDSIESVYSTWAIANGHLACAYPPGAPYHFADLGRPVPFIAPLWPLVSGGFAGLTRIGHTVPFPSQAALGPHCSTGLAAMRHWSIESDALHATVRLGYLCWFALMAGVVALLRTSGRGRCGWEPALLVMLACTPCVAMPLLDDFHPQDVVAMGLVLGGVACVRRGWWVRAGLLLGLAVTAQQFSLLALAPLLIVAPPARRLRFVGAAIGAVLLVVLPLIAITSGPALRAVLLGSGNTPSLGGTVLWQFHLKGILLVAISRIVPILLAMSLAWWALRRLGHSILEPVPLISLVATSLSLRLVFEQNLFGYYFMALAVCLLVLDVVQGQIRGQLVAWLALVALAFDPVPWIRVLTEYLPSVLMAIVLLLILWGVRNHRVHWYLLAWVVVVAFAFAKYPIQNFRYPLPTWFWQVVLVSTGLALAVQPLISWTSNLLGPRPVGSPGAASSRAHQDATATLQ